MKENKLKNYIIFWLSQSVSQLGSSMTSFALIIWAYKQTNSAMAVSLMTFCSFMPYIVVSIFAGAYIDTHRKKSIMLIADSLAAISSLIIFILLVMGRLLIWHIYIVNGIIGFMNSFQSPAQSVAVGIMVPKEKYAKVSGMNSFSNSLLSVVSPMFATFILSFVGLKGVVLIDLISFLFAFTILLVVIKIPEENLERKSKYYNIFHGSKEGLAYLFCHKGIWYIIISMASLNFLSRLTYENILSPMILSRSGNNENVLGLISGILGVGGIIGGLIVSIKKLTNNNRKLIYYAAAFSFLFGDILMGFGQNTYIWFIAAIAASVPIPFINAGQSVILYNIVPREMQGRIFAVRNAVQYCTIPIGILLGGFLADYIMEPFMKSDHVLALFMQKIVGTGAGSGMAVMFLCTGVLGFSTSILWYNNKEIKKL